MTGHEAAIKDLGARARAAADDGAKLNQGEANLFYQSLMTLDFDLCGRILEAAINRNKE